MTPERTARPLVWALGIAASLALVASSLEFVGHLYTRFIAHRPIYQGIDVFWAKPLVNLALFVPTGAVLARLPSRLLLPLLVFPAAAAPLLTILPGSPIPMIVLAAGVAVQAGAALRVPSRQAVLRRAAVGVAVVLGILAIVTQVHRVWSERPAGRIAAPGGAPNVLVIILDTVRSASLAMFGGRAETPHLDALAAAGTTYLRAVSPAPWTLPSHATLFTGLWPHEHQADWRTALDARAPTLAEVFSRNGYRTGGFVANLIYTSREHGLDRGFQTYRDYRRSPGALLRTSTIGQVLLTATFVRRLTSFHDVAGRKRGAHVNAEFLSWEAGTGDRPWFAFLNYFDAHGPFLPLPPFKGRYSGQLPPRRLDEHRFWGVEGGIPDWHSLSPGAVAAEQAAYEEAITGLDADLGALFTELARRGELERTLVVVTSDHGELFGEHDTFAHGNSLYWRTMHVPLIISWPGRVPSGVRVNAPVTLRDVAASVLGLALPENAAALPGTTLIGADSAMGIVLSELSVETFSRDEPAMRGGSLQALVSRDWHYLRAANGHEAPFAIGSEWNDTLVRAEPLRSTLLDSARSRLAGARIPAPRVQRPNR